MVWLSLRKHIKGENYYGSTTVYNKKKKGQHLTLIEGGKEVVMKIIIS